MAEDTVLAVTASFARTLAHSRELSDVLHELTAAAALALGITGTGVSLSLEDRVRIATSDDERIAGLEQVQEDRQQGPCVEVAATGETVAVPDLREAAGRWPDYVTEARRAGIAAVAGVPLRDDGTVLGALDLYHDAPRAWAGAELDAARLLADLAVVWIVRTVELDRQRRTTDQLQRALDSRVVIEQAKGIIAAERGIDVDEAFAVLRKHANDRNASLRATAHAIVTLGLRP